jgi:Rieske Fe-S protein
MKNENLTEKTASRRQFLQTASVAGSALVLGRAAVAQVGETAEDAPKIETVLSLAEHPDLQKVGGYEIVDVGVEKVIVAHTEAGFVACSAICPHKKCEVEYRVADRQFFCPCHDSRFDETGKVLKGPAKTNLQLFDAAQALIVKPQA